MYLDKAQGLSRLCNCMDLVEEASLQGAGLPSVNPKVEPLQGIHTSKTMRKSKWRHEANMNP